MNLNFQKLMVTLYRLTWKLIRTLMKVNNDEDHIEALKINGTDTSDPHAMANGLIDFFTNVAQSLAGKLKSPINLQATKIFIVTSATKEGWLPPPLDFVLGLRYCIV